MLVGFGGFLGDWLGALDRGDLWGFLGLVAAAAGGSTVTATVAERRLYLDERIRLVAALDSLWFNDPGWFTGHGAPEATVAHWTDVKLPLSKRGGNRRHDFTDRIDVLPLADRGAVWAFVEAIDEWQAMANPSSLMARAWEPYNRLRGFLVLRIRSGLWSRLKRLRSTVSYAIFAVRNRRKFDTYVRR